MLKVERDKTLQESNPNFIWDVLPNFCKLKPEEQKIVYLYFCVLTMSKQDFAVECILQYTNNVQVSDIDNLVNLCTEQGSNYYLAKKDITNYFYIPKYESIKAIITFTDRMAKLVSNAKMELNPDDPSFAENALLFDMYCKEYDRVLKTQDALFNNQKRIAELMENVYNDLLLKEEEIKMGNPMSEFKKRQREKNDNN